MAEADGEIEVAIEDTPAVSLDPDEPVQVVKAEEEPKVIEPEEGLEILKGKLEQAQAERQQERAARLQAEAEVSQAKTEVQDTNAQLVTNVIDSLKQANDILQDKSADAMANGDFGEAAKIQREMLKNEAKLATLETGLEHLKTTPKPEVRPSDPVEQLAAKLTPKSAAWVRQHPECATDQRLYQRMVAAHNLALTDGIPAETPEYFAHVERTMGFGSNDSPEPTTTAAQPTQRRQSPPAAAPVTRGSGGGGSSPTSVRLSSDQREMAHMNFPDLSPREAEQAYARHMISLQREGRLN